MTEINLENMVRVYRGKLTINELHNEICRYMTHEQPENMVITIDKNYNTLIYIPIKK